MVQAIRTVEKALDLVQYGEPGPEEVKSTGFRRSLYVVEDVKAGEVFNCRNLRPIRPGYGLHPRYLDDFLGRRAACDIEHGRVLEWRHGVPS
jgi:sialic acid synthase SpsE